MEAATDLMQPLRDITPNSGAYWNESDMNEPNWEHTFWGEENYEVGHFLQDNESFLSPDMLTTITRHYPG